MFERMKALPFVVYEIFIKNCERCSSEILLISVPSFQFLAQGEGELMIKKVMTKKYRKYGFPWNVLNAIVRPISVPKSFCSFLKES